WGQPVALTATLPADATGTVGFYDDVNGGCEDSATPGAACQGLGVANIRDGQAVLSNVTVPLGVGTHYLHASYGGDTHYVANDSTPVTVTVSKASPQVTLSVNGTVFPVGSAPVSLVAQLPSDATGSVGFYDSALPGPDKGIGLAPIVDGSATLTGTALTVPLEVGTHPLYAWYGGDSDYQPAGSNAVDVTVNSTDSTNG
ncbi:MAG TPA: Ig-like domain-containing protein, partial [Acidimicrobiales bacterium]|nr:Ig-like domain-containing protein [Acidimicrobiales bacterium]